MFQTYKEKSQKEKLIFLFALIIIFVSNWIFAANTELSFDEAYYWIYSEYLSWGYFDHPPMVAVFIKLGTMIFGNTELGVRFFFNFLFLGSIFLIWKTLKQQHLTITIISILSMPLIYFSGMLALPDTPLLFFGTLYFYILQKYIEKDDIKNSLFLALTIAAMFYSKYHGLLIVLLTICGNPSFLKQKSFYMVAGLVILFFLPHMYWQYTHEFVSFKFHLTGRVEKHFDLKNIENYLVSQIGLMGMFNFFMFCFVFFKAKYKTKFERILLFNSFGFLIFLFLLSFRNQIEANWTVTCGVCFILLFAKILDREYKAFYIILAFIPMTFGIAAKYILIEAPKVVHYFDRTTPGDEDENRLNEIIGWKDKKIPAMIKACAGNKIVGDSYQIAAKFSFYAKQKIPALHIDSRDSHYGILNLQKSISPDEAICFLTSKTKLESVKIETYFKDPVYVVPSTTLRELARTHGMTYEEIIRN